MERVFSSFKTSKVTVGSTATKLPTTPLSSRSVITVQNVSDSPIYLGRSTVTTSGSTQGFVLAGKYSSFTFNLSSAIDLYGIAAANSDVIVFEAG